MKTKKWRYIAIALLLISLVLASAVPVMAKDVVIVRPNPALDDLTDVDASSPGNGAFLVWNGTATMWVDYILVLSLDDLDDVNAGSPADGQVITWNDVAGEWETTDIVATTSAIWDTDTDTGIQTEESADEDILRFDTAGSEAMVIDASGEVGIGTSSPANKLHLHGTSNFAIVLTNTAHDPGEQGMRIAFDNARLTFQRASDEGAFEANYVAIMQDTGYMGIGTVTPGQELDVVGDIQLSSILIFPGKGSGSTRLLQIEADGGLYQISDRGGAMLAAADDTLVLASGDVGMHFGANINPESENTYILSDGNVYIKTDLQEGWGTENDFVFTNNGWCGIGTDTPTEPLTVKTDTGGEAIAIEENSGGEQWQLAVDLTGDLNFQNSGTTKVHFDDYSNVEIYDGALCVDNGASSCPATYSQVDGYIYCHDVIEYTHYWDENAYGSALVEIMKHKGILSPSGEMMPDYDTFMEGVKVTGYEFPEYLIERFEGSDMTPYEFYNTLTLAEKADVTEGCSGISMGGRISQNEQGIRELYLIIQEQQATIAQQQEEIKALQDDVAKIKELLGIK